MTAIKLNNTENDSIDLNVVSKISYNTYDPNCLVLSAKTGGFLTFKYEDDDNATARQKIVSDFDRISQII